jgi:hypothetical protein
MSVISNSNDDKLPQEDNNIIVTRTVRISKKKEKEYNARYYKKTRTARLEYGKQKIECDLCKCIVRRDGIKKHQKAKKCLTKGSFA